MGIGWIFMFGFWVLIILGVIYLVKVIAGSNRKRETEASALDILKKRYAKGELSKEEFEDMRKDVTNDG